MLIMCSLNQAGQHHLATPTPPVSAKQSSGPLSVLAAIKGPNATSSSPVSEVKEAEIEEEEEGSWKDRFFYVRRAYHWLNGSKSSSSRFNAMVSGGAAPAERTVPTVPEVPVSNNTQTVTAATAAAQSAATTEINTSFLSSNSGVKTPHPTASTATANKTVAALQHVKQPRSD